MGRRTLLTEGKRERERPTPASASPTPSPTPALPHSLPFFGSGRLYPCAQAPVLPVRGDDDGCLDSQYTMWRSKRKEGGRRGGEAGAIIAPGRSASQTRGDGLARPCGRPGAAPPRHRYSEWVRLNALAVDAAAANICGQDAAERRVRLDCIYRMHPSPTTSLPCLHPSRPPSIDSVFLSSPRLYFQSADYKSWRPSLGVRRQPLCPTPRPTHPHY